MKSKEIRKHITSTYISIRIGMAVIAFALPLVLWIGGWMLADLPLQGSMSAYYHAGDGVVRDVFVGSLCAVGALLYLYKGFTVPENWALNLAAVFLVGVAIVPMEWDGGDSRGKITLHGTLAVLFFLAIAYVCIFRASDTLELISDPARAGWYKRIYKLAGLAMISSPLIAVVLTWILRPRSEARPTIFFVEALGVFVFASYWIVKTCEIARSDAEKLAIDGRLAIRQHGLADSFRQIAVKREGQAVNGE